MDYSFSIFKKDTNFHNFLRKLEDCHTQMTNSQITKLADETLNAGKYFFAKSHVDVHKEIVTAATKLMAEIKNMSSLTDAQKEIAGAINGLSMVLGNEKDNVKQQEIKSDIQLMNKYAQQINEHFILREVVKLDPNLKDIVHDPNFMQDFQTFLNLYGRRRNIEPAVIKLFVQCWSDKSTQQLLHDFLIAASNTRETSLDILNKHQIPPFVEDNPVMQKSSELFQKAVDMLNTREEFQLFQKLIGELTHNRIMVTNTQVHTDGLGLAFNAELSDSYADRINEVNADAAAKYQKNLKKLQGELENLKFQQDKDPGVDLSAVIKSLETEIKNLKKLEGYRPRATGFLYERAVWDPPISATAPIQIVTRIISFATQEGQKKETRSVLDFTKILGKENLDLTVAERKLLSELLRETDKALSIDPNAIVRWHTEKNPLPKNIIEVLQKFDNLPHLSTLSKEQRDGLVLEAFLFAFNVNFNLADDLLKVSP